MSVIDFKEHAKEAGQTYKFRCPIEADFKIGQTWKDTH